MMYQSTTPNPLDALKQFFMRKTMLSRLILINTLIFLAAYFIHLAQWLFQITASENLPLLTEWLAVPSSPERLLSRPWTVFTYMFLHENFFHLLFNMVTLYFGSVIFLKYFNNKQLLFTYIMGGLSGALFYILAFNYFPVFGAANPYAVALGASASALAVVIATAMYVPRYTVHLLFIGPVRMQYLALFFILMDIFSIRGDNPGGHIAHLGGAAWAALWVLLLRNGFDMSGFLSGKKTLRVKQSSTSRKKTGSNTGRPLDDDAYNRQKNEAQAQIDQILDKISRHGYDSLTEKEKATLFSHSRK